MKLCISDTLSLPLEAVTEKFAFLGRTGSGKSYAAQKLAEEMHRAKAQFVVLDPVGVWYGLRLAADGKNPGLEVPVLGGLRGDIPLEPAGGALIANLVVDRGASMILDVSQFESDAAKARFAHDFADRFFFRKKSSPSAVHLFVDEAQEFVPQNPQREEGRMLHVFTRLLKLGRNFGIGASLLSQRPQEVNKKALNLAEVLFAFQLTGPQERKTVDGWIADKGIEGEDIAAELPKLARGHPHVWSPAWLKISRVISIAPRWTFDASSTPKVGKAADASELTPIDLEKLSKDMAATIERAKADDPKELRKQIAELKKQLAARPAETKTVEIEKIVEVPMLGNGQLDKANALVGKVQDRIVSLEQEAAKLRGTADALVGAIAQATKTKPIPLRPRPFPAPSRPAARDTSPVHGRDSSPADRADTSPGPGQDRLTPSEQAVIDAAGAFPNGATRSRLSIYSGRSIKSSSFQQCFSAELGLPAKGLLTAAGDKFLLTDAGRALSRETPAATLDDWLRKLTPSEAKVLKAITDAYPERVTREQVAERTGQSTLSSSFQGAFPALRDLELIEGTSDFRASDALMGVFQ